MKMNVQKKFRAALEKNSLRWFLRLDRRADGRTKELAEFEAAGWQSVTLGTTILRAETAAIAALAAAAAILD